MSDLLDGDFYNDKNLTLDQPILNTRIGYQSLVDSISASSSLAGFPISNANTPFTYQKWKPSTFPATINIDMGVGQLVDYVAFGAHEFAGCLLVVEVSPDNSVFTEVSRAAIKSNDAIMLLFEEVSIRYVRVTVTGWALSPTFSSNFQVNQYSIGTYDATDTAGASCAVIYAGKALAMDAPCEYEGHNPGTLNKRSRFTNNDSEGGEWLGRSVVRQSLTTSYDFNKIDPVWFRANVQPFVDSAITTPFFIAWRPGTNADETIYSRTGANMEPMNQPPNNFMALNFSITGYSPNE